MIGSRRTRTVNPLVLAVGLVFLTATAVWVVPSDACPQCGGSGCTCCDLPNEVLRSGAGGCSTVPYQVTDRWGTPTWRTRCR